MSGLDQDSALIRALIDYAGVSAAQIARKARVDAKTVQRPATGNAKARLSQSTLDKLKAAYPNFPGWIRLGEHQMPFRHQPADQLISEHDDSLEIPMLELAYGMGGTFLDDADPGASVERFPRAFVRMFTAAPASQLAFAHGIGDSMEPTIGDRDLLLIDRSRDTIRINDQIWAVASSGIGMVKRVRVEGGGRIVLLSDNQHVPDQVMAEDELTVIGRVVAIVKRI